MPAFLAHFYILSLAYSKANADLKWILGAEPTYQATPKGQHAPISQWAYLGAISPDIPGSIKDVAWIFELIHLKKSNAFVANWIRDIDIKLEPGESVARNLAFLFGFLSHMAADTIIHPYVNTFAGVLDNQSIPVAVNRGFPVPIMGRPVDFAMGEPGKTDMHRFVELHQDSYIATKFFGAKSMSAGDNRFPSRFPSWSSFIGGTIKGGYKSQYDALMSRYKEAAKETYPDGKEIDLSKLKEAEEKVRSDALDKVYDAALGPIPNQPEEIFVQHPKRDRSYEEYIWAAAYASVKYWKAARAFYYSPKSTKDRKKFFEVVRNFNLDTGFAVRVYSNPWKIYIRHEHSWNVLLNVPKPFDAEAPPD
jgi:hypothetical protein